ncbi:hypothetical protein [Marivirga lumbricoides]
MHSSKVSEKGWAAQWKYDRPSLTKKKAVGAVLAHGLVILLSR